MSNDTKTVKMSRKESLLQNIDKLATKFSDPAFPEDVEVIKDWASTVKRSMIQDSLAEHDGIKMILEKIDNELEEIEVVLLNKMGMESHDRDIVLTKKKMYEWFKDNLSPGEDLAEVESQVTEALDSVSE